MQGFNARQAIDSMTKEQVELLIDKLNDEHMVTGMEQPFKTHYMLIQHWDNECTEYLIRRGYKGKSLSNAQHIIDHDYGLYVLHNPDKCTRKEAVDYLKLQYEYYQGNR